MPKRTTLFQQMPWLGGVNTSQDEGLIGFNELTQADNVLFATRGSKKPRSGLDLNWDNVATGTASIYGLHEFWFGVDARQRRFVSLNTDRQMRWYNTGGIATSLTMNGMAWTGTTDEVSMLTFNNRLIVGVNGVDNLLKIWDGSSTSIEDLKNLYGQKLVASGRSSAGTTRTLILSAKFKGLVGDDIVVSGASGPNAAFYNGTVTVLTNTTTNIAGDTITYTGVGSLTEGATTDAALTVDGTAPKGSILREHLGRIWCNDKDNKDRIHYSAPFDHEKWLGFGDSGAMDIGVGDGDPDGILAIFPSFKGELFVAKRTKLYRISGFSGDSFQIQLVSSGIGCIGHNACALVDQDDLYFVSEKGIHSLAATQNFGDFNSTFVSAPIQRTFIQNFSKARLKYTKAAYNPETNCVGFAFTDANLPNTLNASLSTNNSVWLYNVEMKLWYRWPDVSCQSMIVGNDGDSKRFYFGSRKDRVIKSETGNFYDRGYDGAQAAIPLTVATGQINIDGSLHNVKGFKRFFLIYKPEGSHEIDVDVQIDNIPLDSDNMLTFSETSLATLLGVDFILGESQLGSVAKLAPYSRDILGYGRSCKVTIRMGTINQFAEIQGFGVEWEPAGTSPEVVVSS